MWVSSLVLTCKSHTVCGRTASIGDSIQFANCTWMHGATSEERVNRERPWEGILGLKVTCIFHKLHPKDGFWHQVSISAFYKASVATYMNLCLTVSMAGCLCLFPGSSKWNGWRPRNTLQRFAGRLREVLQNSARVANHSCVHNSIIEPAKRYIWALPNCTRGSY